MIRLTVPSVDDDDLQNVREILESGFLVQGQYVSRFEDSIAKYVGTSYAVAVSNCTAALQLSLIAIGVKPDDIVLVPAYSYPATANVIELIGARPIFVDIDPETFNIDPNLLEQELRIIYNSDSAGEVKAILPVHNFGQMAEMQEICEIADRYGIPVIEDAACALGASLYDRPAGTWGSIGCFSFHPRKVITTGEGGVVTTNELRIANQIRALRNHGLDPVSSSPDFIMPGFNYRMTEFQAGLGLSQLAKIDRIISSRRRLANRYREYFSSTSILPPEHKSENQHTYQSFVVLIPPEFTQDREQLITDLKKEGIETTIGTWHIPLTSYYRNRYGYQLGDFTNADQVFSSALTIPLYENLTNEQQLEVVEKLTSWLLGNS